ncbi:MAG: hypothetical protein ACTHOF_04650 [Flavisolibacter sp.]
MEKIVDPEMDRKIANTPKDIPGWGHDADPDNNPTYPIKHYNGADHERLHYEKPPQQRQTVELLKSIERPTVSRVFGTSTPPSGLSGVIRRYAFKHSESTYLHWFPLVVADRVAVVEGIIDDLRHGIVPNLFVEKGWKAEWKYNRKGLIQKIAVTTLVVTTALIFLSRKKKHA